MFFDVLIVIGTLCAYCTASGCRCFKYNGKIGSIFIDNCSKETINAQNTIIALKFFADAF